MVVGSRVLIAGIGAVVGSLATVEGLWLFDHTRSGEPAAQACLEAMTEGSAARQDRRAGHHRSLRI